MSIGEIFLAVLAVVVALTLGPILVYGGFLALVGFVLWVSSFFGRVRRK